MAKKYGYEGHYSKRVPEQDSGSSGREDRPRGERSVEGYQSGYKGAEWLKPPKMKNWTTNADGTGDASK